MTLDHTRVLLGVLTAVDARLRAKDDAAATMQVNAWAKLLAEVDPGYAMRFSEQAYQQVRDWPLQPAEILQAWRADQRAAQVAEEQAHRAETAGLRREGRQVMLRYLGDTLAAVRAGRPFDSVPRPEGAVVQRTEAQEARERRCHWWKLCACDHLRCRDGWEDDEGLAVGPTDIRYATVARCLHCGDALKMAEEQGLTVKPARTGRRR